MGATCKSCHDGIRWAAVDGRHLPFERAQLGDPGAVEIHKFHGTYRARPHSGEPHNPAYRRHRCRKDRR